MWYVPHILAFLRVLSPLFIPIGVSVVHAIRTGGRAWLCWHLAPPGNVGAVNSPSNSIDGLQD